MHTPVFTETVFRSSALNPMKAHMNRYANMLAGILLALMLVAGGMPALAVAQEAPRPIGAVRRDPDRGRQGGVGQG